MRLRKHESNADRQRAYRERQRAAAQTAREARPLPFHGPAERAELRAVLLEAAELLEAATPKARKPKRGATLVEIFDSPQEQQRRKAQAVRDLAEHLAL